MTQEDKDLLLKDLCARLPYGVKFRYKYIDNFFHETYGTSTLNGVHPPYRVEHDTLTGNEYLQIESDEIKPYLFPLSSMTEEQWNNAPSVNLTDFTFDSFKCGCFTLASYTCENELHNLLEFINWLIENHFDIYGLIPKGLAIDATGLNIY